MDYLEIWKDICIYESYNDILVYEKYVEYLANKYNVDINTVLFLIEETKKHAEENIKKCLEEQENSIKLYRREPKEESIRTIIEHNRKIEESKSNYVKRK